MNLLLPELDTVPVDVDTDAPMLAAAPSAPANVPDWLVTDLRMTVLDAVMHHPAEEINAALAAGATDLQTLLEHLAWVR